MKNPGKVVNRALWLFSISVGIYGLCFFGVDFLAHSKESALRWWQVMQAGVMFITPINLHLIFLFTGKETKRRLVVTLYSIPTIFAVLVIFFPYLLYKDIIFKFSRMWYAIATPLYFIFWLIFTYESCYIFYCLMRSYKSLSGTMRLQTKWLLMGLAIGYPTGFPSFFPMYNIDFYNYFNYGIVFYPLLTIYSIIRYRLFEIDTVIHRTLLWLATVLMLIIPVGLYPCPLKGLAGQH